MAGTVYSSADTPQTRTTRRQHSPTTTEPISYTIAEALAEAEDVPVTELELCLAEHVDVDALNALFEHSAGAAANWSLSFTLAEYTICVKESGQITVSEDR